MNAVSQFAKEHGHWLIRIQLAAIFLYHGAIKFPMAEMMANGMGMPLFMVYMLAMAELLAGLFLVAGALFNPILTRISGGIIAVVMAGAVMMVHWPQWGFVATESKPMGGMEFQLLVLLLGLLFALRGNHLFNENGAE